MIEEGSEALSSGSRVVINCLSGRGRTGTLAALLLGKHHRVTSHDDLVKIIVRLRESRDGLVEIPLQYKYISDFLKLPSIEGDMNSDMMQSQGEREGLQLVSVFCAGCFFGIFVFYIFSFVYSKKS